MPAGGPRPQASRHLRTLIVGLCPWDAVPTEVTLGGKCEWTDGDAQQSEGWVVAV